MQRSLKFADDKAPVSVQSILCVAQSHPWDHVRPEYVVDAEHNSGGQPEGETSPRIATAYILPLRTLMSLHSIIQYPTISMISHHANSASPVGGLLCGI